MILSLVFYNTLETPVLAISRMQQAMQLFKSNHFDEAIQVLAQLHLESPNETDVINNLAATYVQRGNNYLEQQKNLAAAAQDYRAAYYLLIDEWPDNTPMDAGSKSNAEMAKNNLKLAYTDLKVQPNDFNWHLNAAKTYRSRGQLIQAFVEYEEASKIKPTDASVWEGQGDIYTIRRRYGKAAKTYEKALQVATGTPSTGLLIKAATAYQQTDTPEKANALFTRVLAVDPSNIDALLALEQIWRDELQVNPNNISAHINLGSVYQQMKRFNEADREYHTAFAMDPSNGTLKRNIASLYHAEGQDDKALAFYNELLLQNPTQFELYDAKATLLKDQGQSGQALKVLEESLPYAKDKKATLASMATIAQETKDPKLLTHVWEITANYFPNDATIQYQTGLVFHEQKQYDTAISYYQRAVSLNPKFAEAYANLGSALLSADRKPEAKDALSKAVLLNPTLNQAKSLEQNIQQQDNQQLLGSAVDALNKQDYASAVSLYQQVIKLYPNNASYQTQYGLALQGNQQYPDALLAYNQALKLDSQQEMAWLNKGIILESQNNLQGAKTAYTNVLDINNTNTDAQNGMKRINDTLANQSVQNIQNKLDEAYKAYEANQFLKASQLSDAVILEDTNNATAYYYKGLALEGLKKPQQALEAYKKSVAIDTSQTDALYALGVLYDTLGQKQSATETFQKFVDETKGQPEDEFIKYAKERLSQQNS